MLLSVSRRFTLLLFPLLLLPSLVLAREKKQYTGILAEAVSDFENGKSRKSFVLSTERGFTYEIRGARPPKGFLGKRIAVTAQKKQYSLKVTSKRHYSILRSQRAIKKYPATGSQKALLLRVQWDLNGDGKLSSSEKSNNTNQFNCSKYNNCFLKSDDIYKLFKSSTFRDPLNDHYHGNVNQFFEAVSLGKTSIGSVWAFTTLLNKKYLAKSGDYKCNFDNILNEAIIKARTRGAYPANYDIIGVFVPQNRNCTSLVGRAIRNTGKFVMFNQVKNVSFVSHEIGHGFGLGHSMRKEPNSDKLEVKDPVDFMSYVRQGKGYPFVNAANLHILKWIEDNELKKSYDAFVSKDGWETVRLYATEYKNKPNNAKYGFLLTSRKTHNLNYYISYRKNPSGSIGQNSNGYYNQKIVIHRADGNLVQFVKSLALGNYYRIPNHGLLHFSKYSNYKKEAILKFKRDSGIEGSGIRY